MQKNEKITEKDISLAEKKIDYATWKCDDARNDCLKKENNKKKEKGEIFVTINPLLNVKAGDIRVLETENGMIIVQCLCFRDTIKTEKKFVAPLTSLEDSVVEILGHTYVAWKVLDHITTDRNTNARSYSFYKDDGSCIAKVAARQFDILKERGTLKWYLLGILRGEEDKVQKFLR